MTTQEQNKRQHDRYSTDVKIHFYIPYDLKTKVDFQIEDGQGGLTSSKRYQGSTINISAGGLCFESNVELDASTPLYIELSLPTDEKIIPMEGRVCWSKEIEDGHNYQSGVQLTKICGKKVDESIYFDEKYNVIWSEVLEDVLGSFAKLHKKNF